MDNVKQMWTKPELVWLAGAADSAGGIGNAEFESYNTAELTRDVRPSG